MHADRSSPVNRRTTLLAAAWGILVCAAGCAQGERRPADLKTEQLLTALREQSGRAWIETRQAELLAQQDPDRAAALREVADIRRAHAEAFDARTVALAPKTSASPAASADPSKHLPEPVSLARCKASLVESQRLAGELAKGSSGEQAGLAASVAAAIRTLLSVTLVEAAQ
ncbi:conserved hypothetical protein [Segniliparus rotundus DSM 44985]|uniref:Uncharacterized protein n=1 Tax=Segniliparus rotundus (strain ATCC BAA-972 / CDC 1076 / CIP 108378 / DSM 44985 / JCM 13578) TaxID=640132 RepID=D6Z8N1_SEGRD|nr:hypothetical protein [Segniliparus rotundus]ADG98311.1 conserved hypothetical protein [Segniliparus rotundus DSM 44985]